MNLTERCCLDYNLPRPTPCQRCAPYLPTLVCCARIRIQRYPWIELVASHPLATLQHYFPRTQQCLGYLGFLPPPSVEIRQSVTLAYRQLPVRRKCLFNGNRATPPGVLQLAPALDHVMPIIDAVVQCHDEGIRSVTKPQPDHLVLPRALDAVLFKDPLDYTRTIGILHL